MQVLADARRAGVLRWANGATPLDGLTPVSVPHAQARPDA